MESKLRRMRGFTLIEVVIVLAIAGLIFVIVFLAVSQAQQARRDTQRKEDASRLAAAVNQYASNNNGAIPTNASVVASSVVGVYIQSADFLDPSTGSQYNVGTALSDPGDLRYRTGYRCNGDTAQSGANSRTFALEYQLEGGQGCVDNE